MKIEQSDNATSIASESLLKGVPVELHVLLVYNIDIISIAKSYIKYGTVESSRFVYKKFTVLRLVLVFERTLSLKSILPCQNNTKDNRFGQSSGFVHINKNLCQASYSKMLLLSLKVRSMELGPIIR